MLGSRARETGTAGRRGRNTIREQRAHEAENGTRSFQEARPQVDPETRLGSTEPKWSPLASLCAGHLHMGRGEAKAWHLGRTGWAGAHGPLRTEAFGGERLACGRGQRTGPGRAADAATVGFSLSCAYSLSPAYCGGPGALQHKQSWLKGVNLLKVVWEEGHKGVSPARRPFGSRRTLFPGLWLHQRVASYTALHVPKVLVSPASLLLLTFHRPLSEA